MTPEAMGVFLERFGLPLTLLVVGAYLVTKRIFVTGSELEQKTALLREDAAYRERLRQEERDARLKAETQLQETLVSFRELVDRLEEVERTVPPEVRGGPERTRRRGPS